MTVSEWCAIIGITLTILGIFAKIVSNNTSSNVKLETAIKSLQTTMVDMRNNHEKDYNNLRCTLDEHSKELGNHEVRISVIENQNKED